MKHVIPLLALLFVAACANLETNAYRMIGTTAVSVDKGMQAWADQVVRKNITFENQRQVREMYRQYQRQMLIASNAVAIYKVTGNHQQVDSALSSLSFISGELLNILIPPVISTNHIPPPLPGVVEAELPHKPE